jgi:hypothetical protein
LRYLRLISRQFDVKAFETEPFTQGPCIPERERPCRHLASQFPALSGFVLLSVGGQRSERLIKRSTSFGSFARLDDVHIRPDQFHKVGGSVIVDVQFEFHPTASQEGEIGERVREVVRCYFQQPPPRSSRGLIPEDGVREPHLAHSIRHRPELMKSRLTEWQRARCSALVACSPLRCYEICAC